MLGADGPQSAAAHQQAIGREPFDGEGGGGQGRQLLIRRARALSFLEREARGGEVLATGESLGEGANRDKTWSVIELRCEGIETGRVQQTTDLQQQDVFVFGRQGGLAVERFG